MQALNVYIRDIMRNLNYKEMKDSLEFILTANVVIDDIKEDYKRMNEAERLCFQQFMKRLVYDSNKEVEDIKLRFIRFVLYGLNLLV